MRNFFKRHLFHESPAERVLRLVREALDCPDGVDIVVWAESILAEARLDRAKYAHMLAKHREWMRLVGD